MKRALLWTLGFLALLAAAAVGFAVTARLAPEAARVELERRLSELVGPVEVGPLRPSFAWGIAVEVAGIRASSELDGAVFSVQRARLTFDLRRLLRGQLRIRRVALSGLRVSASRSEGGAWRPAVLARLLERLGAGVLPAEAGGTPGEGGLERLRAAASGLPDLSIDDAALSVRTPGSDRQQVGVRGLWLRLDHHPLSRTLRLSGAGRLADPAGDRGGLELAGELPARSAPHAELALSDVELALLDPWLAQMHGASLEVAGRASATLGWSPGASGEPQLDVKLLLLDSSLAARFGGDRPPLRIESGSARAEFGLALGARELRVARLEWSSGGLRLAGSARVGLPFDDAAPLDVELRGGPIPWTALRDAVRAAGKPQLRRIADAVTAGAIDRFTVGCTGARWGDWRALAAAPLDGWPAGLVLDADLAGVGIGLGAGEPIRDFGTHVAWSRDHIELRGAHALLGDRPLPDLHLSVGGLRAVAAALDANRLPEAVPEVPGFRAFNQWMDLQKRPGQPPKWKRLELDFDWLAHPVLLRPLEDLRAVLTPAEPGFHVEIAEGYWGGVRIAGRGTVNDEAPGRIELDITASLPVRPALKPPSAGPWMRGTWHADLDKLGPFLAARADGRLQAVGESAALLEVTAALRPSGWTRGQVDFDMSHADSVPYRISLEADDLSLSQLMTDVDLDGEAATGKVRLGGTLIGHLVPGQRGAKNLDDAVGPVSARVRDGEIRRRLNVMMAIAAASDTLNPFRSRDVIPFRKIELELQLDKGIAHIDSMSLTGPAIRMVGTGTVDIVNEPHELQGVVALYFFKTLDRVLGMVPIVNKLLLGEDENLVAAYFAVSGPWGEPKASVIPIKTLLAIPTNIVVEGVPAFVRSGIAQIERVLSVFPSAGEKGEGEPTPKPTPTPTPEAPAPESAAAPGAMP